MRMRIALSADISRPASKSAGFPTNRYSYLMHRFLLSTVLLAATPALAENPAAIEAEWKAKMEEIQAYGIRGTPQMGCDLFGQLVAIGDRALAAGVPPSKRVSFNRGHAFAKERRDALCRLSKVRGTNRQGSISIGE